MKGGVVALLLARALPLAALRGGLLEPQDSESREVKDLSGMWRFRVDHRGEGLARRWFAAPLPPPTQAMAVPSSYNELSDDLLVREHVGLVWYERECFVPVHWLTSRVVLYVGSASHHAVVWLNGHKVGEHEGGHLPFHLVLDPLLLAFGKANRLTLAVNNTLTQTTVPPGIVQTNAAGRRVQRLQMDFFNYAGIHRRVLLYTTPATYLEDISINTRLEGATAHLNVFVSTIGASSILITLQEAGGAVVARGRMPPDPRRGGRLSVSEPRLWWPRYMSAHPAYLYTVIVEVLGADGNVSDVYRLKFGIRTVSVRADSGFLINNVPFYFHGFGKHEDSAVRGRGLDLPLLVKDFSLLGWIHGNSVHPDWPSGWAATAQPPRAPPLPHPAREQVRTTHYPYSEDFLQLCDETGIVVVAEAPAVGLQAHNMIRETLVRHLETITEMVARDKNRASVVMWSVANEPDSEAAAAEIYFKHLATHTRSLDASRPITFATFKNAEKDVAVQHFDVIMLNRYHAWYTNTGQLDIIPTLLQRDLLTWRRTFGKPMLMSEYGAECIAGMHALPPIAFSEEFQSEYLAQYFEVFDQLRNFGMLVGEHVWNFADFMTSQGVTRALGNRKGVFTRDRQPKLAAYTLRQRYESLANSTRRQPLRLTRDPTDALDGDLEVNPSDLVLAQRRYRQQLEQLSSLEGGAAQDERPPQQQRDEPTEQERDEARRDPAELRPERTPFEDTDSREDAGQDTTAGEALDEMAALDHAPTEEELMDAANGMGPTHVWQN